jgi:CubicO group peptidase (beta-lactamase class C family)
MKKLGMLVFILFTINLTAQSTSERIDQLIKKYSELRLFNGSALVADHNETIFKKGYGFANMEWNIPNKPDTKFRLGSITKQFTATLIMQLVEKGKIKLDGKLTDYLTYYRKDTGDKITIHHLLTHTSGIPSYTNDPDFFSKKSRTFYEPDDFVKGFCSGTLEFEPGSQFVYNNSGYFILGAILEKVTGKKYDELIKEQIFVPLGMNNSGYDWSADILPNRAAGYEKTFSSYRNTSFIDMSLPYAAGSLYSTVEDLLIWNKSFYSEKILTKKSWDALFTGYVKAFGNAYYGYGWAVDKYFDGKDSLKAITHGGGINGFNTIGYYLPEKGQFVALFSNTGGAPLNEITQQILNILYGKETVNPKQSLAEYINKIILEDGITDAAKAFNELKDDSENYKLAENEMNNLGYEWLNKKMFDEALAVFKMNIDRFPKSSNTYDSYGEAWAKKGEKDSAIVYYKKSLALNPRNTGAIKYLKEAGVMVEEPSEIKASKELLLQYIGKYEIAPSFMITITVEGEQIFAQASGQPRFEIFPESEDTFYLKVVEAKIKFNKAPDGKCTGLTLFQGGRELPGKKKE